METISKEELNFREAETEDLPEIINLLIEDKLGQSREDLSDQSAYEKAFEHIQSQDDNSIYVIDYKNQIIATMQLTLIPNLTFQGGLRAQIEGVRVKRCTEEVVLVHLCLPKEKK